MFWNDTFSINFAFMPNEILMPLSNRTNCQCSSSPKGSIIFDCGVRQFLSPYLLEHASCWYSHNKYGKNDKQTAVFYSLSYQYGLSTWIMMAKHTCDFWWVQLLKSIGSGQSEKKWEIIDWTDNNLCRSICLSFVHEWLSLWITSNIVQFIRLFSTPCARDRIEWSNSITLSCCCFV